MPPELLYLHLPGAVIKHPALDPTGMVLLSLIAFRDMPGRGCQDSNADLAATIKVSERTIRRALSELKELGFVYEDEAAFDGRTRILRIVPEYYDLLRGGMHGSHTSPAIMTGQGGVMSSNYGTTAIQEGQNGRSSYKDEGIGKQIKNPKKANSPNGVPRSPKPQRVVDLSTVPQSVIETAKARILANGLPIKNWDSNAGRGALKDEIARMEDGG